VGSKFTKRCTADFRVQNTAALAPHPLAGGETDAWLSSGCAASATDGAQTADTALEPGRRPTGAGGFRPAESCVLAHRWRVPAVFVWERASPELCTGALVHGGPTSVTSSNLTTQSPPKCHPTGGGAPTNKLGGTQTFGGHTWERRPQHQACIVGATRARLSPRPPRALSRHFPWEQAGGLGGLWGAHHPKE